MQDNPWAQKYGLTPAAPQQAPQRPATPGVIMGRPKAPNPYDVGQDSISNANEAERLRLAQQAAEIARQKAIADEEDRQRKLAAGPMAEAREGEANNAAFAGRGRKALDEYNAAEEALGGPRSYVGGAVAAIPGGETLLRALPDDVGDSPTRRSAERAKLDFVNLILRSDSGAAVPEEEVARALKTYFPAPGESDPAVLESYRNARETALGGLQMKAGRLGTAPAGEGAPDRAAAFPVAAGAKADPGLTTDGVTPKGTGGVTPVPELYGIGDSVAELIGRGASREQVISFLAEQYAPYGLDVSTEQSAYISNLVQKHAANPSAPVKSLATGWDMLHMRPDNQGGSSIVGEIADSPVGAAVIGAADTVTAGFGDEIAGALGGDTDAIRAATEFSRQERPLATFAGQAAGGALIPIGKTGSVTSLAKGGAAYGGAYGAGSSTGDLGDRLTSGVVGAGVGGAAGALVGKGTNALQSRGAAKTARQTERNALLRDFTDQGVTALPANVGGAPTRLATAGAGQTFLSSGFISKAAAGQADEFGDAVTRNASQAGAKVSVDEAGLLAKKAGERFSAETSARGGKLYERAYKEAGDVQIVPKSAIDEIDAKIARLSQSPDPEAAAFVKELESFKGKLAKGVSVVGLRDARTRLSQGVYGGKLRASADQQVYRDVLGKVSEDIEAGLRGAGKERAANMFKTADKYWSERVDYIDEVLQPIIGKGRSGEDIITSLESMGAGKKGGVDRLRGMMQSLSDEERGSIQSTIIDRLGKATKGQQDAEGTTFSAATFLTRWNDLSPKGKFALFGNSELRQSLDQLARVSGSIKDASKFTNTSNTAGAVGVQSVLSGGALWAGGLPSVLAAGGLQLLTGAALASPKFAKFLARMPKNPTPAAARAYTAKLKSIATAEPVIAADVNKFAQFLNAANDVSPNVAVASPESQQKDD